MDFSDTGAIMAYIVPKAADGRRAEANLSSEEIPRWFESEHRRLQAHLRFPQRTFAQKKNLKFLAAVNFFFSQSSKTTIVQVHPPLSGVDREYHLVI